MNKLKENKNFDKLNKCLLLKLYIDLNNLDLSKSDGEILEMLMNKLKKMNHILEIWEDNSSLKEELKNDVNEISKYSLKESEISYLLKEEDYDDNIRNTILECIINEIEMKYLRNIIPQIQNEMYIILYYIIYLILYVIKYNLI